MAATDTQPTIDLHIRRVAGCIGANIDGVDLAQPLPPATVAALRDALHTHKVLFFRGQHLDHASHVALGEQFGPLTRRAGDKHGVHPDGYPQILTMDATEEDTRYGTDFEERLRQRWTSYIAGWHSDLTPHVNPPMASILRAERVPSYGGDTQWTDLTAAYAGLSEPLRDLVDKLHAEHAFFAGCQFSANDPDDVAVAANHAANPQAAIHPVVRVHPDTGERSLFVNPASTSRIVGLTPTESRALLDLLFAQITRSEYTVRFRWAPGSVAFWDNRSTAHLAATDTADVPERRTMHRVAILGDRPVGPDGFTSEHVAGEPLAPYSH